MKTENYVMVPFDSISLRTKFKEKKSWKSITLNQKSHCTKHKMMKTENTCKNDKRKIWTLSAISYFAQWKQQIFVPIPTLRRDDSRIEPCQVGIPTSPGKVRIPTLSGTILELSRFLLCAEHMHIWLRSEGSQEAESSYKAAENDMSAETSQYKSQVVFETSWET